MKFLSDDRVMNVLCLVMGLLIIAAPVFAYTPWTGGQMPEVVVVESEEEEGWDLYYHNGMTADGAETMLAQEVGDDLVVYWEFERTDNYPCVTLGEPEQNCADTIHVFAPDGYVAVPGSVTLLENTSTLIKIRPYLAF